MNKKLIGTLASVVLLTGITTGTTSLAQEVEDGTNDEQNTQPVVSENKSESVEQITQPVVTEQKSEPVVEQKVVVEQTQEAAEENTSNEVDNVENNETNEIQTDDNQNELEVDEVDTSIDENENLNEENSDVKEEDSEEIEAPDLSKIEPVIAEEEVLEEEVVENEDNEVEVEVQSVENNEDETSYNSRYNQQDTSPKKPKQKHNNDTPENLDEDEEISLDEITPDITESQPLSLHDEGSETKYIVELDKEETDDLEKEKLTDDKEQPIEETADEEIIEETDEEVSEEETELVENSDTTSNEEDTSNQESGSTSNEDLEEHLTDVDEKTDNDLDEENVDEAIETDLDEEQKEEIEVTDEAETVDEELTVVDDAELLEPILVEESESNTENAHQLSEHEVTALSQNFDNSSNYNNTLTFEIDNSVDNDWQNILNERGTSHITFEREGIEVSIERLENDRIEITYAFRDALDSMSAEELEAFIYGEYQKDKANINEGGQTEFLTKHITDRLNDTSSNPSVVHGASETSLSTPQELPKTGIALIGGTVGSALALLFSGAFAGLFSLRRK